MQTNGKEQSTQSAPHCVEISMCKKGFKKLVTLSRNELSYCQIYAVEVPNYLPDYHWQTKMAKIQVSGL